MVIGVEEMKLKVVFFSTSFYLPEFRLYDCFIYMEVLMGIMLQVTLMYIYVY